MGQNSTAYARKSGLTWSEEDEDEVDPSECMLERLAGVAEGAPDSGVPEGSSPTIIISADCASTLNGRAW